MKELTVLLLTPLQLEFDAVARHVHNRKSTVLEAATYETGSFDGAHHSYRVVLCQPGMKNVEMALATERAIQKFQPQFVLLIGIAGGVKDVHIADVLIATKAYGYDAGKEDADGFKARPSAESFSADLLTYAQQLSRSPAWKKRTTDQAPDASIFLGPIAAGDKVVASTNNPTFQRIKQHFNDTLGLEMEVAGFATALQKYRHIHSLAIRGISDLCEGKSETDKENWQPVAADRAAAVAFELLYQLDTSTFISPPMDAKTLAKEIYALLFPMPESFKEIGSDFANAANNDVREIWKKVKPLFIEEVKELAQSPDDPDTQADVRNKLKRELEGKADFQQELAVLLNKAKEQTADKGITIINSKNVVTGGNYNVTGDFRIGDG
ncbi:MAG: 5'-methylthioadenosine/S-adenosylhomocysteine nucleosidase [Saprospiraceae bacterium]|nr:5'-methylthioadenosine/S-adenosylhomocysteine nucleosidase [Saprospiraceae bacterium]